MYSNDSSVPSENPSTPNQPAVRTSGSKRFGKKFYAIAGIITIAVIAIALLIPQGAATIPLSVNYTVGEKMIYSITDTITGQINNNDRTDSYNTGTTSFNYTVNVDVVDFDGEYYTLNHTLTAMLNHQHPMSLSFIEKVNKTGYTSYFSTEGTLQLLSNKSSNPFLSALLNKPEVKVGDTWQIPLSTDNTNVSITGDMTITFRGIQDITVPAGTYKVFRIDFSSNNLSMNLTIPTTSNTSIQSTMEMSISGQTYLEYRTCRQIESDTQINSSYQIGDLKTSYSLSSQMVLVQHITP